MYRLAGFLFTFKYDTEFGKITNGSIFFSNFAISINFIDFI